MTVPEYFDCKIGRAQATMLRLSDYHIPPPDQIIYSAYTEEQERGDRSFIGVGAVTIKWVWDILATWQVATLNMILQTSATTVSSEVYIRSPKRDGSSFNESDMFTDFKVYAKKPKLDGKDGQGVTRSPHSYSSVTYLFNVLEEV